MGRRCVAVAVVGLATGFIATEGRAQGYARYYYRVVMQGQQVKVETLASLDPTCRSLGRSAVNLLTAPAGGQVGMKYGFDYPNFPVNNPRSVCDRVRVPVTMLSYRANVGFTGPDSFVVEEIFPDGLARRIRYNVTVR